MCTQGILVWQKDAVIQVHVILLTVYDKNNNLLYVDQHVILYLSAIVYNMLTQHILIYMRHKILSQILPVV